MDILLSPKQYEFCTSDKRETFYISGIGSGKTFCLAARALIALSVSGAVIAIYAPTTKVLRFATLRGLVSAWEKMGFVNGVHYVVDVRPKWKHVKPFSVKDNKGILTTVWGSYAILDGLDNYNSQRGQELDEIFVDEFRDIRPEARDVLIGRLRGQTYKNLKKEHRIWYATTPPDNPYYLQKLAAECTDNQKFIFGTTYDNIDNLPPGYIESQISTLDPETIEREIMGRFVFTNGKRFAYMFSKEKHIGTTHINDRLPLYLSFDFNLDPATCIIGQHTENYIHIHGEIRLRNASIYDVCSEIKRRYPGYIYVITGDAAGNSREKATRDLTSMYDIIQMELGLPSHLIQVDKHNPTHRTNRTLVNSIFQHLEVIINPSCEYLIQDLDMVQCDETGSIDKSNKELTHLLDCYRYYVNQWFSWFLRV
jgi:hypothetical protein